jgi:hypothetical protein
LGACAGLAVEVQQVEGEVADAVRLVSNCTVQAVKVRHPALILNYELAINDRR